MKKNIKISLLALSLLSLTPVFGATDTQDTLYINALTQQIKDKKEQTFGTIKYGKLFSPETVNQLLQYDWTTSWSELQTRIENYINANINTMDNQVDTLTLNAINDILTNINLARPNTITTIKTNMRALIAELNTANSKLKQSIAALDQKIAALDQKIDEKKSSKWTPRSQRVPLEKERSAAQKERSAAQLLQNWNNIMLDIATRIQNEPNTNK